MRDLRLKDDHKIHEPHEQKSADAAALRCFTIFLRIPLRSDINYLTLWFVEGKEGLIGQEGQTGAEEAFKITRKVLTGEMEG